MFENRKYLVFPISEIPKIDFSKVLEEDVDSLQYYGNGEYTAIKWEGENPEFIANIQGSHGPFSHAEVRNIIRKYGDAIYNELTRPINSYF